MTNMNIQHLESLNDHIFNITGIRVRETVPDWLVKSAAEVVMVDATTEALLNRLKRGVIYAPEKAQRAMENFFKESTLVSLRELALRQTAHELDIRRNHRNRAKKERAFHAASPAAEKEIHDRILIYVTAGPVYGHAHSARPQNGRLPWRRLLCGWCVGAPGRPSRRRTRRCGRDAPELCQESAH